MSNPLSINLNTTQATTAIPMIRDGTYAEFKLTGLEMVAGEKGQSSKWTFELVNPAPDTEGGQILPGKLGSKQFVNIQFYSKPDAKDPSWFVKKVCNYVDALLNTGDSGNKKGKGERPQFFDPEAAAQGVIQINEEVRQALIGKSLVAKMKVKTGEFEGNEFAAVLHPSDVK